MTYMLHLMHWWRGRSSDQKWTIERREKWTVERWEMDAYTYVTKCSSNLRSSNNLNIWKVTTIVRTNRNLITCNICVGLAQAHPNYHYWKNGPGYRITVHEKPHCTVVHFLVCCHFFTKSPFRNMVSSTVAYSVGNWISRTHQQVRFLLLRIYTASIGIKFNARMMTSLAPPFSTSIKLQHYFLWVLQCCLWDHEKNVDFVRLTEDPWELTSLR